jgi:hypothetical protein
MAAGQLDSQIPSDGWFDRTLSGAAWFDPELLDGGATSALTGAGAFPLADDTTTGTGGFGAVGTGAFTLADDTTAGAGAIPLTGAGAVAIADDIVVGAGGTGAVGAGAVLAADDTAAGAGTMSGGAVTGPMAAGLFDAQAAPYGWFDRRPSDAAWFDGELLDGGASGLPGGTVTLADDTVSGTGLLELQGTAAVALADDLVTGAAGAGGVADGAFTLAADAAGGAGIIGAVGLGAFTLVSDVVSGAGAIDTTLRGTGVFTLASDVMAGAGIMDSTTDATSVAEDAIYAWIVAGSALAPDHVIWANAGNGGPSPAGLYISMRLLNIDTVSADWLISRRSGTQVVHHVRGTRHPVLELTCSAGSSYGARRAEMVLARVVAAIRLPSVAKMLRKGAVGVGESGPVRVIQGRRSGMFDPRATVEIQLHTMIDVSEVGAEFVSASVTTPGAAGGVTQTVTKP